LIEDEIVNEVRAARDAFAAAHGYGIRVMVAGLRDLDAKDDRRVVRLLPRRPAAVRRESTAGPSPAPIDPTPPTSGSSRSTEPGPAR